MWIRYPLLFVLGLCVGGGCSPNTGPLRVRVTGVVERKAEPLINGTITFLPAKGHQGPAANGVIRDGKFDIPAAEGPTVGPHQVLINLMHSKSSAEFASGMPGRKTSNQIRWEFQADITEEPEEFDFILEDK